jgi:hypothetical protein
MEINFVYDEQRALDCLDWECLEALQDGTVDMKISRKVCATFLVDEAGQFVEYKKALSILGSLKVSQITNVVEKLKQLMEAQKTDALPLVHNGASSTPTP